MVRKEEAIDSVNLTYFFLLLYGGEVQVGLQKDFLHKKAGWTLECAAQDSGIVTVPGGV